jgi:hypothetical protein
VIGVEPHSSLVALAQRRTRSLAHVRVLQATAQRVPLPDAHVDVVHARWAYFFGPGCEPGLRELERLVRRGGAAFVIDNDTTRSTFGAWFRRALPAYDSRAVERFWSSRGWQRETLDIGWEFERRATWRRWCGSSSAPSWPSASHRACRAQRGLRRQPVVAHLLSVRSCASWERGRRVVARLGPSGHRRAGRLSASGARLSVPRPSVRVHDEEQHSTASPLARCTGAASAAGRASRWVGPLR